MKRHTLHKQLVALLLSLVLIGGLMTTSAASGENHVDNIPGTGALSSGGTVTLTIRPDVSAVAVGSNSDVYVNYTAELSFPAAVEVPALSFVLRPGSDKMVLATQTQVYDPNFYYRLNPTVFDITGENTSYRYYAATRYLSMAGTEQPLALGGSSAMILEMMVRLDKGSVSSAADYYMDVVTASDVAKEVFAAGIADGDQFPRSVVSVPLAVMPGAGIYGTVKDTDANAVSGAAVELFQNGRKIMTAAADGSGSYAFTDLSTGVYTVRASAAGLSGTRQVTVAATDVVDHDLTDVTMYAGVEVGGTVTSFGDAAATFTVKLMQGETVVDSRTGTGNSAHYAFDTVPAGEYTLSVSKPGHADYTTPAFTVGSEAITDKNVSVYLWGDANGDGETNPTDAVLILRSYSGIISLDGYQRARCDVNGDGETNPTDAVLVLRKYSGILSAFPVE